MRNRGGRYALLMMIMPPESISVLKKVLRIFERRGVGSAFKDKMDATAA